jgi:hypothetical protein
MDETPTTRASLLLRLADPRDERAWAEFVAIYGPCSGRWRGAAACRRATPTT